MAKIMIDGEYAVQCQMRGKGSWTTCEECPSRFICYTSKVNKYCGDPLSWIRKNIE